MYVARMGLLVSLVSLTAFISAGCQSSMAKENRALWDQNRELQARLASSESGPKTDPTQLTALQQQIAERDAKINDLQGQLREPAAGQTEGDVAKIETSYDKTSGKMTVAVPGDVLFAAGDATVKDAAKSTLDKVATSLKKDYSGKKVRIEGHTDADPIKYSKWKSNEDLSVARAAAVKAYLVKKGVDPSIIVAQGYGADKPKSAKDKAANRRVDIVVAMR
jgi:flagellar motor protein MotB